MKNLLKLIVVVSLFLEFCSCATTENKYPITTSLDELHGEVSDQVLKDSQIRLVSIAGLLPDATVGLSHWYRKEKTGMAAVGRTASIAELQDGDYITRLEIASNATLTDLTNIQGDIETAYMLTGKSIAQTIDLDYLTQSNCEEKDSAMRTEINSKIKELQASLENLHMELSEYRIKIMEKMAQAGGIIIITWENTQSSNYGMKLLSKIGYNSTSQRKISGYAILSGIRLSQLMLGTESINNLQNESFGKYFYMNSIVLQSENIIYSATLDLESEIIANLDADINDFKKIDLSKGANVKIDILLQSLTSLSNRGCLGKSDWSIIPMSNFSSLEDLANDSDGWKTIYTLKTRRRDLGNWFDEDKKNKKK